MLKAALIHGIQDRPEDWIDFTESCSDFMEIERIERPPYDEALEKGGQWKKWDEIVQSDCRKKIAGQGFDMLLGHSGGCKRVLHLMMSERHDEDKMPNIGIVINPPRREIDESKKPTMRHFTRDSVRMLAPLLVGMPQEIWQPMIIRHGKNCRNKSVERARIITEFKLHAKSSKEIAQTIADIRDDIQLFVFGSKNDPWYTEVEAKENVEVRTEDDFGHYGAHVWKYEETSRLIRDFCQRHGMMQPEENVNSGKTHNKLTEVIM